jgi:hypothetical protein
LSLTDYALYISEHNEEATCLSLTIRNKTARSVPKIVKHRCELFHDLQNSKTKIVTFIKHVYSTFYVMWENVAKFSLDADNRNINNVINISLHILKYKILLVHFSIEYV